MVLKKLFGSLVLGAALAFGANAQETPSTTEQMMVYDRVYGAEEDKVKTAKEHFEFGKKLAEESRKNQALEYIFEAHALAHLEKAGKADLIESYNERLKIHEDNIQDFPDEKTKYLELIVADAEDLLKKLSTSDKENKDNVYLRLANTSFKLGNIFEEEMKYRKAVNAFYNAESKFKTVKDPKNASIASKRAKENAKFADEDDSFRKLAASENLTPDDRFNIGVEYFRRGEHGLAKKFLDSQFGDKGNSYLAAIEVIENKNQKIEDVVAAARLFEERSRNEKRTGVKAILLSNALSSYNKINSIAQSGSLEATEASSMVGKLKEELEKCGSVNGLEAIASSSPSTPSSAKIPAGAVLYMSFDKNTIQNGFVRDLSGNNNHGKINGNPKLVKGIKGEALEFDGDDYVEIVDSNGSLNVDSITIYVLAKSNKLGSEYSENGFIFDKRAVRPDTYSLDIHGTTTDQVQFAITPQGAGFNSVMSDRPLMDKNWHCYVGTYDGNMLKLFIDNILQSNIKNINGKIESVNPGVLHIGKHTSGNVAYFFGSIDELMIFNKALSESEIKKLYTK